MMMNCLTHMVEFVADLALTRDECGSVFHIWIQKAKDRKMGKTNLGKDKECMRLGGEAEQSTGHSSAVCLN